MALTPTVYNTGNPVPSNQAKDLDDDVRFIDTVANDQTASAVIDRLGNSRDSLSKLESQYIVSTINGGIWAAGVEITAYNQYMNYTDGTPYKVKSTQPLPYTTVNADATLDAGVEPFSLGLTDQQVDEKIKDVTPQLTNIQAATVADMVSGLTIGGQTIAHAAGQMWSTSNFRDPEIPFLYDGGGANYIVVSGVTANGFADHDLGGGLTAMLWIEGERDGEVDVRQCGAWNQSDKQYNNLDDAKDSHAALSFAFSNFKAVKGAGRYLCKGVLRTPQKFSGPVLFWDEYRWQLRGDGQFEIVLDLTVVPPSERTPPSAEFPQGVAVGFGLSHKDYTKPDEWGDGSNIYNGIQRNVSIRDVQFWNRNWTSADRDNETLNDEIGFSLFAGSVMTVDNVGSFGFKIGGMTSCWASTFTNIRFQGGEYGIVPFAGTTIVMNTPFCTGTKYGITTREPLGITSADFKSITYGLTLNCPAADNSGKTGQGACYQFDDVWGLNVNILSMEAYNNVGCEVGDNIFDINISGHVSTPVKPGAGELFKIVGGNPNKQMTFANMYAPAAHYSGAFFTFTDPNVAATTKLDNVKTDNMDLLTNLRFARELKMLGRREYIRFTEQPSVANTIAINESDLLGIATDYTVDPEFPYSVIVYRCQVKIGDGTGIFIYNYDLAVNATSAGAGPRTYKLQLNNNPYAISAGSPPTILPTVSESGGIVTCTFNDAGMTLWGIFGVEISLRSFL